MHLLNQLAAPPSLDRVLRPLLLINNVVAMSLSFAAGGALFIVLGVFFAVSIVFNILVVLLTVGQRQLRLNTAGDPQCPSLIILAIETLGVMAFLVLYVCTTINAAAGGRYYYDEPSVMMLSYASIGALVAMSMHGWMTVTSLREYIRYRQTLGTRCPHCHRGLHSTLGSMFSLPPSPHPEEQQGPRQSYSANSHGEAEEDRLITTKDDKA